MYVFVLIKFVLIFNFFVVFSVSGYEKFAKSHPMHHKMKLKQRRAKRLSLSNADSLKRKCMISLFRALVAFILRCTWSQSSALTADASSELTKSNEETCNERNGKPTFGGVPEAHFYKNSASGPLEKVALKKERSSFTPITQGRTDLELFMRQLRPEDSNIRKYKKCDDELLPFLR